MFWSCEESYNFVDLNKNSKMDKFEDPSLETVERAKDILSYLSIEEKIAQLESSAPSIPISDLDLWDSLESKFSVPSGQYVIHLGTSSANLFFSQNFIVK